jgi:hypothetical protein
VALTSTVPTVKARLVTLFDAALTVPVTYAWPGPETADECVFLGPHPSTADIRIDLSSQIPTIKAGRKQRQEEYVVRVTVWSFRPELTPVDAQTCEERAFALAAEVEDVLADDPRLGLAAGAIQYAEVDSIASTLFPFKSGWATELAIDIRVRARLT